MLNKEKYAEELLEILLNCGGMGVVNQKPVNCDEIECIDCDFYKKPCVTEIRKWANSEYIKPQKLTQKERRFCEIVEHGWLAKDWNNEIHWYRDKPVKGDSFWRGCAEYITIHNYNRILEFSAIQWTDEEPWSVEALLKLEVEEC